MSFNWTAFLHLGIISCALLLATAVRARVRFFQRYLVPSSLIAGFALLFFYNFLAAPLGLDTAPLGELIYHLLSLSFIAMSLRDPPGGRVGRRALSTAVVVGLSLALQALLGMGLTFGFIATLTPDLFPSFGLFLPLGYEMGPGQAYSIGKGWEDLGIAGAASVGLTFAALGFVWACFGGVFLINRGIRKGWLAPQYRKSFDAASVRSGVYRKGSALPVGSRLTTDSEAIDTMSVNLGVTLVVYLVTFLLLKGLTALLSLAGAMGRELAVNLWALSFVFAALLALGARWLMQRLRVAHVLDTGSLTRISGVSVDLLVTACLAAISLVVVARYWLPLVVIGVLGGVVTMLYVLWLASRLFDEHQFQEAMVIYGGSTGTLPTGLALLRVIDPEFASPAAMDYMYGSGIAFFLGIPMILSINLPVTGYLQGRPQLYGLMFAILAAYIVVLGIVYRLIAGRRAFAHPASLWYRDGGAAAKPRRAARRGKDTAA